MSLRMKKRAGYDVAVPTETALLVGVRAPVRAGDPARASDTLDELAQLADTAGAQVADRIVCRQARPRPATFIGAGKVDEIAETVRAQSIGLVLFDDDLTPAQGRNLEALIPARVIDRTQLILDIFARHAHTREGALQVELAQLQYTLPRLRRLWTHLERQKGGIGLTGPGEKQLELDRRRILSRIVRIRREIENIRSHRAEQRRGRRRHGWALVTLVGYTNAGKSTLLNQLTGASVETDDRLFATLDPTTREVMLPNRQRVLVTDTVGFIRKLPHHLVDAFKATLEEVVEADLLLHVIDAAHPASSEQIDAVERVLDELGCREQPLLPVLNKADRPEAAARRAELIGRVGSAIEVSALRGEGMDALRHELADRLRHRARVVQLNLPLTEGDLLAAVHRFGHVLSETYNGERVRLEASIPVHLLGAVAPYRVDSPPAEA